MRVQITGPSHKFAFIAGNTVYSGKECDISDNKPSAKEVTKRKEILERDENAGLPTEVKDAYLSHAAFSIRCMVPVGKSEEREPVAAGASKPGKKSRDVS